MRIYFPKVIAACAAVVAARGFETETRACSGAFKNVVFNSGVNSQPDIVSRFQTLQAYGISMWVGFTLDNAQPDSPVLNDKQLKMVVSGENIQAGLDLVSGPNAPQYLALLNEPDGGFYNLPIYSPQEAVDLIRPFLDIQTTTQYLSPAPAYPDSDWLTQFFNICQCQDSFPVILAHVYDPSPEGAIATIQHVMNQFPGKPIWITEISPASSGDQGCTLDEGGMIDWMNQVIGWASQQAAIERIFWNCGEYGTLYPDQPKLCNPSLTNVDGTATVLLEAFGQICAA